MSFNRLRFVLPAALLAVSAISTTAPLAAHADTLQPCNGGARIVVASGTLSLSNCTISGITLTGVETNGAGVLVGYGASLSLTNVTVSNNQTPAGVYAQGAGIDNHGTLTLDHVSITGNSTDPGLSVAQATGTGGGIDNDGTVNGSYVTVSNNSANSGGGIRNYGGGTMTLTHSTISNNTAFYGGGVLNIRNQAPTSLTISYSMFTGNQSSDDGGGILNSANPNFNLPATLNVDHTTFSNNVAAVDGGGLGNNVSSATLLNDTFNDNTAKVDGGGISVSGPLTGTNLTIVHNTATKLGGGIVTDTGGNTSLINSTISDNSAGIAGGGANEGEPAGTGLPGSFFQDVLLARNAASSLPSNCGGLIQSKGYNLDTGSTCAFAGTGDQSNVGDAATGLGTLANNGGAVMTEALSPASHAVDKGGTTCAATDARDLARPQGPACDIGAFELENTKRDTLPPTTTASFAGTNVGGNSYTGTVTASLNAADNSGGTGVAATYYALDNSACAPAALTACTQYTAPFVITGVGPHTVYFFSVDLVGNTEAVEQQSVQIVLPDTSPPTTTAALAGPSLGGSSYSGPVKVTLSATDNAGGSGVAATYYAVDNAACAPTAPTSCHPYSAPFVVSSAVAHIVYFFSVDKAGNAETVKQSSFTIVAPDTTPPTTTAKLAGTSAGTGSYSSPVTVTLSAADDPGGSGVATTYYAIDTTSCTPLTALTDCQTYSAPFTVSGAQSHTVYFFSVDKAGNAEVVKQSTFTIVALDTTPPTTTASLAGPSLGGSSYSGPVIVTLSATDTTGGSGVATTYYATDNASCTPTALGNCQTYSASFTVTSTQSHTVYFFSVDKAGNAETVKQVAFQIVNSTPQPVTINGDYQCSSGPLAPKSVIKGRLIVGAGVGCVLTGVRIGNGVSIAPGGSLVGHTLIIYGDVQGDGAQNITLDDFSLVRGAFNANGTGGVSLNVAGIGGDVQINNTTGTAPGGINLVCSSALRSLQINGSAATAPFDVGGSKDCVRGNIIARDAQINNNAGAITVSNNRIGGSLQTKGDTGGLTVSNNHVGSGGGSDKSKSKGKGH